MISRTLIAAAVAAACTYPAAAVAARDAYPAGAGYWTVSTPSSVNESAPWRAADPTPLRSSQQSPSFAAPAPAFVEVITPLSVNESAPWLTAQQSRARNTLVQSASLPNPQTPWSANESAPARYNEEMRDQARHVASVQQRRVVIARMESERLAAIEREQLAAIERERLASIERERLASAPESSTAVISTPAFGTTPVNTTSSEADIAPNRPRTPGELPTQPDQSVGLVDTRRATTMSLTTAPETGASGASAASVNEMSTGSATAAATRTSPAEAASIRPSGPATAPATENTGAEANTAVGVGATRSEGTDVNGMPPALKEPSAQSSPQATVPTAVLSDPTVAPSVSAVTPEFDAGQAARSSESTPVNAYVTLHESAAQANTR
jgi:hypothetical protein